MIDHLKTSRAKWSGIVKDDPKVLDSYERFLVALRGLASRETAQAIRRRVCAFSGVPVAAIGRVTPSPGSGRRGRRGGFTPKID